MRKGAQRDHHLNLRLASGWQEDGTDASLSFANQCLLSGKQDEKMNVESYRRRAALERKRGRGRPPIHATTAVNA
jgi:hypothetical protein